MTESVVYALNTAPEDEIRGHLLRCDMNFLPPLSTRVEVKDYANKIWEKATRFEAWEGGTLVGLVAVYCNDIENFVAYITSVSVLQESTGKGVAACLMRNCIEHARSSGMKRISLEVACDNTPAIRLYEKFDFIVEKKHGSMVSMNLYLNNGDKHGQ